MKYVESESPFGGMMFTMVPETKEEKEEMKAAKEWSKRTSCKCKEDHNSYFVPDNKNEECMKHHYRCYKCDKITQIG